MRVARYWARAQLERDGYFRGAWGASDESPEDAQQKAQAKAQALLEQLIEEDDFGLHHYEYQRHDLPEPIVEDINDSDGNRIAAITTNRYGAHVLNTARLVFVDVDLPVAAPASGLLGRLFGRQAQPADLAEEALERLRVWARQDQRRGARAYRTAAGLRYLLTHPAMSPDGDDTVLLMEQLGADPLYTRLCRAQGSFRARLSPKPWRIGVRGTPKLSFEKLEGASEETRRWLRGYHDASRGYAVCSLLEEVGSTRPPDHDTSRLIASHDEHSGVGKGLPLA